MFISNMLDVMGRPEAQRTTVDTTPISLAQDSKAPSGVALKADSPRLGKKWCLVGLI